MEKALMDARVAELRQLAARTVTPSRHRSALRRHRAR